MVSPNIFSSSEHKFSRTACGVNFLGIVIVRLCACGSCIGLPRVFRYNAVLSFHQLVENSDESFLLDNDSWLKFAPNNLVHSGLLNHS